MAIAADEATVAEGITTAKTTKLQIKAQLQHSEMCIQPGMILLREIKL